MKAWEIVSGSNRNYSMFQQLLKAQGVKRFGLSLISGPKQVREILDVFPDRCAGLILRRDQDVFDRIVPDTVRRYHLAPGLFRDLDIYGTDQPILLVRVEPFPLWNPDQGSTGCTLFVPFQDPTNVGAVIRSAAAFGVSRVVMLKESAHPFHHKASRVAGSTLFRVPIFEGPSIKALRRAREPMITLSADGEDVGRFAFPPSFGLVPGLEGPGVPAGLKQLQALAVPMEPGVESLNAALATAIVLYLWRKGLPREPKSLLTRGGTGGKNKNLREGPFAGGATFRTRAGAKSDTKQGKETRGSGDVPPEPRA